MGRRVAYQSWVAAALFMSVPWGAAQAQSVPASCTRAEFEAVVDGAGATLRDLTQKNSPSFQAKLRQLKDKRGWSTEQFMAEGARFVQDDTITAFDDKSGTLLAQINGAGASAGQTSAGQTSAGQASAIDCSRLVSLKADLAALVAIQTEKWAYMFGNVDAELGK